MKASKLLASTSLLFAAGVYGQLFQPNRCGMNPGRVVCPSDNPDIGPCCGRDGIW